jgi:hypothetical protein
MVGEAKICKLEEVLALGYFLVEDVRRLDISMAVVVESEIV